MIAESEAGGPQTKQGKEVVRWNATRHGISSPLLLYPAWKSRRTGRSIETASSKTSHL
jgi:hypothetical protein